MRIEPCLLSLIFAGPALAAPGTVLMPENPAARAQQEQYGYAEAVIVGDTIYLSGVIAGPAPGETSLEPAYERAFAHIASILARAGASWADVADMTTFHTDLPAQIAACTAVKNRYVKAPFPAWTAIGISRLFEPTGITEIKVTAHRRPR
ncbi:RidA family protein [Sandarakinorhabdus sp.]|uniref:RidA family protein n=1 Tax=Sandarakinorhabdus sp. TaxID=1916663 RepID=UPI00286DEB69|nr:RidA family protein [Sandarakinorhabdus sp.]